MSLQTAINTILTPIYNNLGLLYYAAGIKGYYGEPRGNGLHQGIDFNYFYANGTPVGQNGINLEYPPVYSPVKGEVVYVDPNWGRL